MEGNTVLLPPEEVLHIPGLSMDGLVGLSPIAACRNAVGAGLAADEYSSRYYANGAAPLGILETPTLIKNPELLRQSWNEAFGGSRNAGKVAVLEQGVTFKPVSLSPQDSQLLETRRFSVEEICRIFRVPPHMVQDLKRSTYNNIEHQSIDFVVHTLAPWLTRIEQAIITDLLLEEEQGQYFPKFNVDGLLRGDYKSRMEGYAIGFANGFLSPNDIRRLENMDPIPEEEGGSVYVANGSYVKLKDIGAAYSLNQPQTEETKEEPEETKEKEPEEETNNSEKKRRRSEKGRRKGR
jgi:HK97 family phage portal protein